MNTPMTTRELGHTQTTPGPWRRDNQFSRVIVAEREGREIQIATANLSTEIEREEAEANAELIASLPDLLSRVSQLESDCRMKDEALRKVRDCQKFFFPTSTDLTIRDQAINDWLEAALSPAPQPGAVQADDNKPKKVRSLSFERINSGIWFVVSDDEPSIFIAHKSLEAVIDDLPNVLRRVFDLPASPLPADDVIERAGHD